MTKKRFWFVIDKGKLEYVQDNVSKEKITVSELEDLLNEQQAIIHRDEISIKTMMSHMKKIEEENEQLRKELKELNKKYIAFSEATDKRLKEMMK